MRDGYVFGITKWDRTAEVVRFLNEARVSVSQRAQEIIRIIADEFGTDYCDTSTTIAHVDWPTGSESLFDELNGQSIEPYEFFPPGLLFQVIWEFVKKKSPIRKIVVGIPPVITRDGCKNILILYCFDEAGEYAFELDAYASNMGGKHGQMKLAGYCVLAARRK